jgi:hypothetical protein
MIEKQSDLQVGDKVHYQPKHYINTPIINKQGEEELINKFENGIVKEIPEHTKTSVRVVYNCNGEWNNYQDYTSALTDLRDLNFGWL